MLVLTIGCQSKPKSQPPMQAIRFDSYAGSLLSGPMISSPGSIREHGAWRVRFNLIALERNPGAVLQSAGSVSRMIRLDQSGEAYQAVSQLAQRARVGWGDEANQLVEQIESGEFGEMRPITIRDIALPDGVTTRLNIIDISHDPPRNIEVAMQRSHGASTQQMELLISMCDLVKQQSEDELTETAQPIEQLKLERVLLDPVEVIDRETILLLGPRDQPDVKAILLILKIEPGDDSPEQHAAFAQLMDEVHASDERIKSRMVGGTWPGFERALENTSKPETRRASLQFIASRTGAVIVADLILLADTDVLAEYTHQMNEAISASSLDRKPELLGWLMDRVALEFLTRRLSDDAKMPNELRAILLRHAGEPGRDSATMSTILRGLQSRQEFSTRLIAENLIALEDTSPATRVGAFDWLVSIQKAPQNYDPLGPDDARKTALEAIEQ